MDVTVRWRHLQSRSLPEQHALNCLPPSSSFLLLLLLSLHRWGWWWWVQGTSVNLLREDDGNGEQLKKNKKKIIFHQSIHQKPHRFNFLSVFHLTVQIHVRARARVCAFVWSVCDVCLGRVFEIHLEKTSQHLGMFHSILKHAEHRTLNTYTEQLVLSKCSFSFFFISFRTEWL